MEIKRHSTIIKRENSALLIVDVQEKIIKVMRNHELLIENILKLIKGMNILKVPIFYTEQYPKGLGPTTEIIKKELKGEAIQKLSFSCFTTGDLFANLLEKNIKQIVVCGIESHVCVQQTVLDLLANGFQVHLPLNTISSRNKIDYKTAVKRMEKKGAEVTTVESVLFELLEVSGTSEFKSISSLIK